MENSKEDTKGFTNSALFQTLYPIVIMLVVFGLVFLALYVAL